MPICGYCVRRIVDGVSSVPFLFYQTVDTIGW